MVVGERSFGVPVRFAAPRGERRCQEPEHDGCARHRARVPTQVAVQRNVCKDMFACNGRSSSEIPVRSTRSPTRSGSGSSAGCGGRPAHRVGGGASDRRELGQRVVPPATARPLRARRGGAERGRAGAPLACDGALHVVAERRRHGGAGGGGAGVRALRPRPVSRATRVVARSAADGASSSGRRRRRTATPCCT